MGSHQQVLPEDMNYSLKMLLTAERRVEWRGSGMEPKIKEEVAAVVQARNVGEL